MATKTSSVQSIQIAKTSAKQVQKEKQMEKKTEKKEKKTTVQKAFRTIGAAQRALEKVMKRVGRWPNATNLDSNSAVRVRDLVEEVKSASTTVHRVAALMGELIDANWAPTFKGAGRAERTPLTLAVGAHVWLRTKDAEDYADAVSAEDLDNLFVRSVTRNGKVWVQVGDEKTADVKKVLGLFNPKRLLGHRPFAKPEQK